MLPGEVTNGNNKGRRLVNQKSFTFQKAKGSSAKAWQAGWGKQKHEEFVIKIRTKPLSIRTRGCSLRDGG